MCQEPGPVIDDWCDVLDCINDCPDGDQACQQNCINSYGGHRIWPPWDDCWLDMDIWSCWELCPEGTEYADCPDEFHDCMEEEWAKCGDEYDYWDCFPPGDLSCKEVFDCFGNCDSEDTPCYQDCYQGGTEEAPTTASDMWDCYEDAGVYDCWDQCPRGRRKHRGMLPRRAGVFRRNPGHVPGRNRRLFPVGNRLRAV